MTMGGYVRKHCAALRTRDVEEGAARVKRRGRCRQSARYTFLIRRPLRTHIEAAHSPELDCRRCRFKNSFVRPFASAAAAAL
jgi:hypothetical protein